MTRPAGSDASADIVEYAFAARGCSIVVVEGLGVIGECAAPIADDCDCWFSRETDRIHTMLGLIDIGGESG